MAKILTVDDDLGVLTLLTEALRARGHDVWPARSVNQATDLFKEQAPELILTDIEMPEGNPAGLQLLGQIKISNPECEVIVLSGQATKQRAITALRAGAFDFIEKPFQIEDLLERVESALVVQRTDGMPRNHEVLKRPRCEKLRIVNMVGKSPAMERVYELIERVAGKEATVLIRGESGTGKELVAHALHQGSPRAQQPFVAINCAALPEHLLESELFGHRKGAFTGAAVDKIGLFQAAEGGTVFLDEVGSMPLALQGKLLRFLQERELRRVGDTEMIHVNVRIVAATNEALESKLADKSFREDLYYRLSVIPIALPPLRSRRDDILLLATKFIDDICQRHGGKTLRLTDSATVELQLYTWPGNVRELQNVIERACVLCNGNLIEGNDLPEHILRANQSAAAAPAETVVEESDNSAPLTLKDFTIFHETAYVRRVMAMVDNNRSKAAELLGVSEATISRRLSTPIM